jgi:hypothetical protein
MGSFRGLKDQKGCLPVKGLEAVSLRRLRIFSDLEALAWRPQSLIFRWHGQYGFRMRRPSRGGGAGSAPRPGCCNIPPPDSDGLVDEFRIAAVRIFPTLST